ncbi:hypothetical protein [Spiroplasma turonicum]|uniref:Acetyltransferase n=1 Tax=Spiroplasma turonicum TaxID=216946 RepID=A0A0K1P7B9_9MOLU|nr:hypothetical protein [Spiroplasma turonicum]AKU80201.1 hypothetical protein STURON_00955 [Spiroplasma turonicum]ALX71201.1 hypothetical protein STURO_v1c09500 [Spiroplasma turonicum]
MAKNKEKITKVDLSESKPKKGLFKKIFASKSEQKKILQIIKNKNIDNLFFYTDVNNLLIILENGIQLVKEKIVGNNEEYIVWTYLEHKESIGLEFETSTRAHFWKWATNSNVDVERISVIGINPYKLADLSKNDWAYDSTKKIIYVYETIPVEAIEYIMIKDKSNLKRIQTFVDANDIDIDVFYGESGNIDKKEKK